MHFMSLSQINFQTTVTEYPFALATMRMKTTENIVGGAKDQKKISTFAPFNVKYSFFFYNLLIDLLLANPYNLGKS